jgi:hypothetical protein
LRFVISIVVATANGLWNFLAMAASVEMLLNDPTSG